MAVDVQTRPRASAAPLHREPPGEAPEPIVQARAVHKTYDTGRVRVHALRGVDLTVGRGEMVAIMGPSGCGKTTLLNCLSGLDAIDAGEVVIEGTPLASMSDRERTDYRARRMGFVFQFYNLMPVLTAVENVELPLLVARVQARGGAARGRSRRSTLVGLADGPTTCPTSSRAASASASRSPARSSTTPRSCGPTSRPATSTARTPRRSSR